MKRVIPFFRILLVFAFSFLFFACPPKCNNQLIVISPIPDSILNLVPYGDGQKVCLRHSEGTQIEFNCSRSTHTEFVDFERGCGNVIEFEVNCTILTPEYPLPEINITIQKIDEEYIDMNLWFAGGNFNFIFYESKVDSLIEYAIGDHNYSNVWAMKSDYYNSYLNQPELLVDSLYFNADFGILRIKMNNGEAYDYDDCYKD